MTTQRLLTTHTDKREQKRAVPSNDRVCSCPRIAYRRTASETETTYPRHVAAPTKLTRSRTRTICDGIRTGRSVEVAAGAAGINRRTFARWDTRGRAAIADLDTQLDDLDPDTLVEIENDAEVWDSRDPAERGDHPALRLIPETERPYVAFCLAVEQARDEWEGSTIAQIQSAALPQTETTTVEKIDPTSGDVVERRVTTRKTPGSWQAAAFLLERKLSNWQRRTTVEGGETPVAVAQSVEHRHRFDVSDAAAAAAVLDETGVLDRVVESARRKVALSAGTTSGRPSDDVLDVEGDESDVDVEGDEAS